jgi:subtilase family serine protease
VSGDTVDLTVRVANAGAYGVKNVTVTVYADTSNDTSSARAREGLIVGEVVITKQLQSQAFEDVRFTTTVPAGTKRFWFVTDSVNRYFESNEKDNVIRLDVE